MERPSISYRGKEQPIGVEDDIRDRVAEPSRFFDRITACRVVVEARHRRQRHGGSYHIHIDLSVADRTIVAGREPAEDHAVRICALRSVTLSRQSSASFKIMRGRSVAM